MARDNQEVKYESRLEQLQWQYINIKSGEIKDKKLTTRLVLDFQNGVLNTIQEQSIIAGASNLSYFLDRIGA